MNKLLSSIALLVSIVVASTASAKDCSFEDAPASLTGIVEPGPDVPAEFARWIGVYSNDAWGGSALCATLVVESVDPEARTAEVIYAHGKFLPWNLPSPKAYPVTGRFVGEGAERLRVDLPWKATAFYVYKNDAVEGTYGSSRTHLTRIQPRH